MTEYAVALTTVNSKEEARKLAKSMVECHLAACVNIIPDVISVYNWKGNEQQDQECILVIKTCARLIPDLQAHFAGRHPYEVPELVVLRIEAGSESYLEWMAGWLRT